MEAVSNKDLNADGKIEGRKGPKTKAEQQAEWKKEHELRREEHEKQFREWAAEKAKGSKDPLAQLSSQELEVVDKLRMLMSNEFNSDREQMFKHYDADHTGSLQHEEVRTAIKDAGVSPYFACATHSNPCFPATGSDTRVNTVGVCRSVTFSRTGCTQQNSWQGWT